MANRIQFLFLKTYYKETLVKNSEWSSRDWECSRVAANTSPSDSLGWTPSSNVLYRPLQNLKLTE